MAKAAKAAAIRAATHDDLRAIVGIYNWAVNQTFATIDSEPLDTEEAAHWWEAHGKRSKLLVATDETGVVGWARLFPWNQRGFDVVEDLVYRTIVATIATDNRSGLQLHTGLGFETVGTIRNAAHKFDRWMDITLVQRSLE